MQWNNNKFNLFTIQLICLMFQLKLFRNSIFHKPLKFLIFKVQLEIHFLILIFLKILLRGKDKKQKLV